MEQPKPTKKVMCITVDTDVFYNFKSHCRQYGMKMSTKLNNMMLEELKKAEPKKWVKNPRTDNPGSGPDGH